MKQIDFTGTLTITIKDANILVYCGKGCKGDGKSYNISVVKASKGDYWCAYKDTMAHCALLLQNQFTVEEQDLGTQIYKYCLVEAEPVSCS